MANRAFIVHGWDGYPDEGWFPWLKKELEARDFEVKVPAMPNPIHPKINTWVSKLRSLAQGIDDETYFVGHSIGCQTILRYLQTVQGRKAAGVVLVAPWVTLSDRAYEVPKDRGVAKPWI
jgi:predicted alpha/beta hydrolase family esterase